MKITVMYPASEWPQKKGNLRAWKNNENPKTCTDHGAERIKHKVAYSS
jgi:hypothetical protein